MSATDEQTSPLHEALMERRTVVLSGEIDDDTSVEVGQRLLTLQAQSSEQINLIIRSDGGCFETALELCDLITAFLTAPVRGIAFGACGSSATFILLHCTERVGTPHTQFLVHSGRHGTSIPVDRAAQNNVAEILKKIEAIEETVMKLYMRKLTPTAWTAQTSDDERRTFVQQLINRGDQRFNNKLTAEEAIEVGLITKIAHEKLDIFPA